MFSSKNFSDSDSDIVGKFGALGQVFKNDLSVNIFLFFIFMMES